MAAAILKTLLWGLALALKFDLGAWPHGRLGRMLTTHERYQKRAAATPFMTKNAAADNSKTLLWGLTPAVSFQKILYFGA